MRKSNKKSANLLIAICGTYFQIAYPCWKINFLRITAGLYISLAPPLLSGPAEGRGVEETPLFSPPALGTKAVLSAEEIRFVTCIGVKYGVRSAKFIWAPCALGCSDFWFFSTVWGKTTHPWHPKGPRICKLAKKNLQLHPWLAKILAKTEKCVILYNFQFTF